MRLVENGKRGFPVLALIAGVCLTPSCASTAPSSAQDWGTLRRIDLPAELVRVTWSEESYLSEGHPTQFGRTAVKMQASGVTRRSIVKAANNAADGVLVDNLTCYNAVRGEGKCALLLNRPNRCYLFVYAGSGTSVDENFDVDCPAHVTLGQ
jgi:hypothetical protein